MPDIERIATGVPGLDVLTHGGLPARRATLVVGRSGTGKTVLALQIAAHLVRSDLPTLVVAVEEPPVDLVATGDSLGFEFTIAIADGRLAFTDVTRPGEGPVLVSGEYDLNGLIHRIEALVRSSRSEVVILDSATALFSPRPPQELLRNHFFQLVHALRRMGVTAVITAEAGGDYGPLTTLGVEDYVCDMTIVLRNVIDGERRRRTIEINKYRRSAHYKGEYPCTITRRGLAIFPLDPPERPEWEGGERYSSGLEGLDTMTSGGWLRNSIMLVKGPTGSGKTMLAGQYALAGARRGERVVYYGFEEPRPILLRNFRQIGLAMDESLRRDDLRVICRYPEATSLEDLLVDMRIGLEEFKPSLIVLDSISSIEHASSEKGFRQFMIGLASVLREHGRSAFLTQTIAEGRVGPLTAPYLSTVADAILALDYSSAGFEINRTMRVIKMRGSAHDTHPYRLHIGAGGLHVERLDAAAHARE